MKSNGPKNITPEKNTSKASRICLAQEASLSGWHANEPLNQETIKGQKETKALNGRDAERIRLEQYCHIDLDRLMAGGY